MNHYESSQHLVFVKDDVDSYVELSSPSQEDKYVYTVDISPVLKSLLVTSPQFHIALASPCLFSFPSFLISSFLLTHFPAPSLPSLPLPLQSKTKFLFYFSQHLVIFSWPRLLLLMPSRYRLLPVNYRSVFSHEGSSFSKSSFPFVTL